jgi:aspartyl-tRNA(Asn)/glutamyl-tRNA(Gln) amidotransferase subunit C
MLSQKQVQQIASLARLNITQEEMKKYQEELSSILEYIEKLGEIDVSSIEAMSHPGELKNVFRTDEPREEKSAGLIELAPQKKDGYLKVKSILKKEK